MEASTEGEDQRELRSVTETTLLTAGFPVLTHLMTLADIRDDPSLENEEDIRQRLVLIKRAKEGRDIRWTGMFQSLKSGIEAKTKGLSVILEQIRAVVEDIPIDPLSSVLRVEEYLEADNLYVELDKRTDDLNKGDTLVVVMGETNAGKSTVLNTLLGSDVLPTDFVHCTIAITKIKYAPTYSVEVVGLDGQTVHHNTGDLQSTRDLLISTVAREDTKARAEGTKATEVTLYMPADILKCGVTLVDTPGIGESENIDQIALDFVRSTHAHGFVYVIKSDNAGGVHEDRLLACLRAVREQYSNGSNKDTFDPKSALFICHRWDCVKSKGNADKVKANAFKQLASVWPAFEPTQAHFFSSTDTLKHLGADPRYVSDSYFQLLCGIRDLFQRSINNAIFRHQYTWLKNIIHPASLYLRTMIKYCIKTDSELDESFKDVRAKQDVLISESQTQVDKLRKELQQQKSHLENTLSGFLEMSLQGARECLLDYEDLVQEASADSFLKKKENRVALDEKLVNSLIHYVDVEIRTHQIMDTSEKTILQKIEEHLGLFKTQVTQIKRDLFDRHGAIQRQPTDEIPGDEHRLSISTGNINNLAQSASEKGNREPATSCLRPRSMSLAGSTETLRRANLLSPEDTAKGLMGVRRDSVVSGLSGLDHSDRMDMDSLRSDQMEDDFCAFVSDPARLAAMVKAMMRSPTKIKGALRLRLSNNEIGQTVIGKIKDKIKYDNKDPSQYIEQRCKRIADTIRSDQDMIQEIVDAYAVWIEDLVDHTASSIPKFTAINAHLMEQIRHHRDTLKDNKENLKSAMKGLEQCRRQMKGYVSLYMEDIPHEFLDIENESSVMTPCNLTVSRRPGRDSGFIDSGSNTLKIRSFWARLLSATCEVSGKMENVVIKAYIICMDEDMLLREIAELRCLQHENVAPFFGMTRCLKVSPETSIMTESTPHLADNSNGVIFKGELVSAKVYAKRNTVIKREWVPGMLKSLMESLEFIHKEDLVHMELNMDTVTIDSATGAVKLCHIGLPRTADLPENPNFQTKACVCLSPSVLNGAIYQPEDDVYAFGILLWELLFPTPTYPQPFAEQRLWPLSRFIEECCPASMLRDDLKELQASEEVSTVLHASLCGPKSAESGAISMASIKSTLHSLERDPNVLKLKSREVQRPDIARKKNAMKISRKSTTETPQIPEERPPRSRKVSDRLSLDRADNRPFSMLEIESEKTYFPVRHCNVQNDVDGHTESNEDSSNQMKNVAFPDFVENEACVSDPTTTHGSDHLSRSATKDRRLSCPSVAYAGGKKKKTFFDLFRKTDSGNYSHEPKYVSGGKHKRPSLPNIILSVSPEEQTKLSSMDPSKKSKGFLRSLISKPGNSNADKASKKLPKQTLNTRRRKSEFASPQQRQASFGCGQPEPMIAEGGGRLQHGASISCLAELGSPKVPQGKVSFIVQSADSEDQEREQAQCVLVEDINRSLRPVPPQTSPKSRCKGSSPGSSPRQQHRLRSPQMGRPVSWDPPGTLPKSSKSYRAPLAPFQHTSGLSTRSLDRVMECKTQENLDRTSTNRSLSIETLNTLACHRKARKCVSFPVNSCDTDRPLTVGRNGVSSTRSHRDVFPNFNTSRQTQHKSLIDRDFLNASTITQDEAYESGVSTTGMSTKTEPDFKTKTDEITSATGQPSMTTISPARLTTPMNNLSLVGDTCHYSQSMASSNKDRANINDFPPTDTADDSNLPHNLTASEKRSGSVLKRQSSMDFSTSTPWGGDDLVASGALLVETPIPESSGPPPLLDLDNEDDDIDPPASFSFV